MNSRGYLPGLLRLGSPAHTSSRLGLLLALLLFLLSISQTATAAPSFQQQQQAAARHLEAISTHCASDSHCTPSQICHPFLDDVLVSEVYDTRCVTAEPWKKAWLYCLSARVQDTWPYYVISAQDYVHCEKKVVVKCPAGTKIVQRNGDPFCKEWWP